jgi:FKBP-type peptidyl-prolyl cis-trans isomerase 2
MRLNKKRDRQERSIKRLENTLKMHEANELLTVAIMEDKGLSTGSKDKIESVRKKKIERIKKTIENTKKRML